MPSRCAECGSGPPLFMRVPAVGAGHDWVCSECLRDILLEDSEDGDEQQELGDSDGS